MFSKFKCNFLSILKLKQIISIRLCGALKNEFIWLPKLTIATPKESFYGVLSGVYIC